MATILVFVLSCVLLVNGASINRELDSYEPAYEDDIQNNIIPHNEEVGDIEGLLPPLQSAEDYYKPQDSPNEEVRQSDYVMDTENKQIRLKDETPQSQESETSDGLITAEEIARVLELFADSYPEAKENKTEEESWRDLKPVITLTHDGITMEFSGKDKKSAVNVRESTTEATESETVTIEEDIPLSDEPTIEDDSSFLDFFQTVWGIVRSSVDYATNLFGGMVRPATNETEVATSSSTPSSVSAVPSLVALEEPLASHRFPSHEFEKGGRDIDSLLYGRGIA